MPPTRAHTCIYKTYTRGVVNKAGRRRRHKHVWSRDLKIMAARAFILFGAGDATGGAIAKRFAREGFTACVARRSVEKLEPLVKEIQADGGKARAFGTDASQEDQVKDMFRVVEEEVGPIEACVFNVGNMTKVGPINEISSDDFRKIWESTCFSGFLSGREAALYMKKRGRGTILFTGATASMRGGSGFSAFAAGKFGLRALSQSMARELGPQGIHVAHVVIDGIIDTQWFQQKYPEMYAKKKDQGGILNPEDIAESYWQLHVQKRSAWTQELDLRPWTEKF